MDSFDMVRTVKKKYICGVTNKFDSTDDWAKFAKEEPGYIFIASDILQKFQPEQAGPVARSISGAKEAEIAMTYTKINKSI